MACAMAARSASGELRMPRIHFLARARFQLVEQVVRLHALALAPAHFDVRPLGVLRRNFVAHFDRAARRERHHVVGEMLQVVRLFGVAQRAQRLHHHLLRIGLPRVDHVVHFLRVAEVRALRARRLRCSWWSTPRGRRDACKTARSKNRAAAARISRDGWRCPCRRKSPCHSSAR